MKLLASVAVAFLTSTACWAGELYRLTVDLDGDGKAEVVEVSTGSSAQAGEANFTVKIGDSDFSAEYLDFDGGLPNIKIIAIDWDRPQRQLMVEAPGAINCYFHILSYVDGRIVHLLRYNSDQSCVPPESIGHGQVSISSWEGFWRRWEHYELDKSGVRLIPLPLKNTHLIRAPGAANATFTLQGAECSPKQVMENEYVRVELYDPQADRYRLETLTGGCGWLPAKDLSKTIGELPWAG